MSEELGNRFNAGKLQWSLIDFTAIEDMVRVLEFGKSKYGEDNWKKGLVQKQTLDSLSRHLIELMKGNPIDEESKLPHIAHVMANAMFYAHFEKKEA